MGDGLRTGLRVYHQWEARLQHFQEARLLVHVEARLLRSLASASRKLRLEARLHRFQVGCQARQVHHQPGLPWQQVGWAGDALWPASLPM